MTTEFKEGQKFKIAIPSNESPLITATMVIMSFNDKEEAWLCQDTKNKDYYLFSEKSLKENQLKPNKFQLTFIQ